MEYQEFLESKKKKHLDCGFNPDVSTFPAEMFDFQRDVVEWACKKGRCALFLGTGLGKTICQLTWADQVVKHTGRPVLILAPLAVASQTSREGEKFHIPVNVCRRQEDVTPGINITNYEMLDHFDVSVFSGVVLDESSILKALMGKLRTQLIESFQNVPYRLACTATPAPNDHMELTNHSEFLGVMKAQEVLAMFFTKNDCVNDWSVKPHAQAAFWEWVASWAVMMQNPRDLGYNGDLFDLPPLNIVSHVVTPKYSRFQGRGVAHGLTDRRDARRESIEERIQKCADIVNSSDESWVIWCGLNAESAELKKRINGAVEVTGSDKPENKESRILGFSDGSIRILVSKSEICGFGINMQVCHNMAFVGLSDSFEQYYQAVRRCWRFGQTEQVNVHVITSEAEGAVVANIKEKERKFKEMLSGMIAATQEINTREIHDHEITKAEYKTRIEEGKNWKLYLGDNIEQIKQIEDNSVGFSIFSPPFSSLFTYSNSPRDMGNCKGDEEFYNHFMFLAPELLRVMMPGRSVAVHCMQLPSSLWHDGYIGLRDFRGDLIRIFQSAGFIYHSEICVWKNPVQEMYRTKALGLLHKQLKKDSAMCRQGKADYILVLRKPGENTKPITHDDIPVTEWQQLASPVWMNITQTNVLQGRNCSEEEDEKHICPLQLDVIENCLKLWSAPGDLVLDPFTGIGSSAFQAVLMGRKAVGIELKESYYIQAVKNCKKAESELKSPQVKLDEWIENKDKQTTLEV